MIINSAILNFPDRHVIFFKTLRPRVKIDVVALNSIGRF